VIQDRRRDRWPRQRVLAHQERQLEQLRAHAYAHSPFYRRFHAGLTNRPLSDLPVLTKSQMMEHFDELVTDRAIRLVEAEQELNGASPDEPYQGRYWLTRTGGSSGQHGIFVQDPAELAAFLSTFLRARAVAKTSRPPFRRPRMAIIPVGSPTGALAQVTGGRRRTGLVSLRVLNRQDPLDQTVARLNDWNPGIRYTSASILSGLVEEQLAGRLRIAPGFIVLSGEILTQQLRRRAEAAWGKVVYDAYGAAECGLLAIDCQRHVGLHLINDRVILEVVDADNQPTPPGQCGSRVLITVLYRRTQPLIRYELTDLVYIDPSPCACGHPTPRIGDIQGRVWEVLHFPSPDGGQVAVQPLTIYHAMQKVNANWQSCRRLKDCECYSATKAA
jgi:phenylacetate-CoA ligase